MPALAHRLVLRPELWVQQVSADDVVRDVARRRSDAARPRTSPPRRDARGEPAARGIRGRSPALGLVAALALRRPELAIAAAPFALLARARHAARPGSRARGRSLARRRSATLEGDEVEARARRPRATARSTGSSSCSSSRDGVEASTARTRVAVQLASRRGAHDPALAPLHDAGASTTSATSSARARARSGSSSGSSASSAGTG